MATMRLFNEPAGHAFLERQGVEASLVERLPLLGISSISNVLSCIKTARYYEMDGRDVLFCPLTDSMELYSSRMEEMKAKHGPYTTHLADQHYGRYLMGIGPDYLRELGYADRRHCITLNTSPGWNSRAVLQRNSGNCGMRTSGPKYSHRRLSMNGTSLLTTLTGRPG